jgi:tripartite-type tricarboxylate transporter receptor subunit TctC
MHSRRRFLGVVAVGAALPFTLRAQGLETAKIIVGFPPGGTTDVMARKVAESCAARSRARSSSTTGRAPAVRSASPRCVTRRPTAA